MAPNYLLYDFKHSLYYHTYNARNKGLLRLPLAKPQNTRASFGAKT